MAIEFGKGIALAGGFDLGAKAPLDSRLTVATIEERDAHITGNRAYDGMLVYVEADKITYQCIADEDGNLTWKEFGFSETDFHERVVDDLVTEAVDKALSANQGVVLKGLIDDEVARATESENKLQEAIDTLDTYVGDIPEGYEATNIITYINKKAEETLNSASGGSSESAASVLAALNTYKAENDPKVTANTSAIATLNGDSTVEGSVDKKVADAINEFATQITDDGTINTFKEVLNYISTHGGEAADMMAAIDVLEELVGSKSVATQIAEAITAENLGQYATDDELAEAIARIVVLEGATHTHDNLIVLNGITSEKITAWDSSLADSKAYTDEQVDAVEEVVATKADASALADEVTAREELDARVVVVEGKAHTHANAEELDKIADGDVAKWNAISDDMTAYVDAEIDKVEAVIGDIDADKTVVQLLAEMREECEANETAAIAAAQTYTDTKISAVNATIGTVDEGKTVVQMLAEAREAAVASAKEYTDAEIAKVNTAVSTLSQTHATDKAALEAKDAEIAGNVTALQEDVAALKDVQHVEITTEQIDELFA